MALNMVEEFPPVDLTVRNLLANRSDLLDRPQYRAPNCGDRGAYGPLVQRVIDVCRNSRCLWKR